MATVKDYKAYALRRKFLVARGLIQRMTPETMPRAVIMNCVKPHLTILEKIHGKRPYLRLVAG